MLRVVRFAAAAGLAMLAACTLDPLVTGPGPTTPIDVDIPAGCNPLATSSECLLPFPSSFVEDADPTSPTGVRIHLDANILPKRDGMTPLDVRPFNTADGASPVAPILLHFGFDVDLSSAPSQTNLDLSISGDSPIVIFDMDSGKRVRFFAEMDANRKPGVDGRYVLILRPMAPMEMGHHMVVVLRDDLKRADGTAIAPTKAMAALRDRTFTTNETIERMRPGYEEIFTFLIAQNYDRRHVLLAWDFHVASEDYLLGSVLSLREQTLKLVGETGLPYKITNVLQDPSADVFRIVEGDFEVPTFLKEGDDTFDYDTDHHPILQPKNRSYPFTMIVPNKAKDGPLPLVVIGHGIFGTGRDFLEGAGDGTKIQALAQQFGAVVIATDWIGLSNPDLPQIASEVTGNLDRVNLVTDKLQQALMNTITMTKLARGTLTDDPMIKPGSASLLDDRVFYWGASLGGIEGSSFISLSNDISRAVFGVPGAAWGTMLSRSIVFTPLEQVIAPHYPDPADVQILLTLFQARFDHADPANITKLMFKKPLADAPPNRLVILQESIGDSEVPNISTDILARAMGVSQMTPSLYTMPGLPQVASPATTSIVSQYRLSYYDKPLPPTTNTAPSADNNVHHDMNFLDNVHTQIASLFLSGQVVQSCDGPCDPN